MVFVARHGETDWNVLGIVHGQVDIPLNARGRQQARNLAHNLEFAGLQYIVSSDLSRSSETAQIIADHLGLDVVTTSALRECSFGILEGTLNEHFNSALAGYGLSQTTDVFDFRSIGGEDGEALHLRMRNAFVLHCQLGDSRRTLFVSHGRALNAYFARHRYSVDLVQGTYCEIPDILFMSKDLTP